MRKGETEEVDLQLVGHTDTITGLSLSPDGNHLLSNGMDSVVHQWDIRPFAINGNNRLELSFTGAKHGAGDEII